MKILPDKISRMLLKAFYPSCPYCPSCGRILLDDRHVICDNCAKIIFAPQKYSCKICGRAIRGGEVCNICYENKYSYNRGISLFVYDRHTAPIIYSIKYGNNIELAQRLGSLLYYDICRKSNILSETDLILPVPLHKDVLKKRGYNQAEIIAGALSDESGIIINNSVLIKIKATADQIGLKKLQREKNLKESFDIADKRVVENKNVMLIDDVLTTGATVNACCDALKKHGANKVFFAVLASKTY